MQKKRIFLIGMLAVLLLCTVAMAKEYPQNHTVYRLYFWTEASVEDVKNTLQDGYNINSVDIWDTGSEGVTVRGYNLLALALFYEAKLPVLEFLLKNGARVTGNAMYHATDIPTAKLFIKYGGDINALNDENSTVLHNVELMDVATLKWFLENGAAPDVKNIKGDTPLSRVYDWTDPFDKKKADLLIKAGAKLGEGKWPREVGLPKYSVKKNTLKNYSIEHNYCNNDFWRVASLKDVEQSFIKDINLSTMKESQLPCDMLFSAVSYTNDPAVIDFFIKNGPPLDHGFAVVGAATNPNPQVFERLLEKANAEQRESYANYMLFGILNAGMLENLHVLFKMLPDFPKEIDKEYLKQGIEDFYYDMGETSKGRPDRVKVLKAIERAHAQAIQLSESRLKMYTQNDTFFDTAFWSKASVSDVQKNIKKDYDINSVNTWTDSNNSYEYRGKNILLTALVQGADSAVLEELLKNGARMDGGVMCNVRDLETLQLFLKYGGDVNALDNENNTLLSNALSLPLPMVEFLLKNGAEPNMRNLQGNTPLSMLYDNEDAEQEDLQAKKDLLTKAGAKLGQGIAPRKAGVIKYEVKKNIQEDYNIMHNYYNADFWRAASLAEVKESLLAGKDLNATEVDAWSRSILYFASAHVDDPAIIEFLIENGAKVEGDVLRGGAINTNSKILQALLKYADVDDTDFSTPALMSIEAGLTENLMLLVKKFPPLLEMDLSADDPDNDSFEIVVTKGRPDRAALVKALKKAEKQAKNQ